jgi:3-oxoacyl-[acyl-carrier protein] reductase
VTDHASQSPPAPLAGRVAVVTGGSRGLGLAITHSLAAAGAHVVAGSRYGPPPDHAETSINWDQLDVTDPQSLDGLFGRTFDALGGVHIVVANAGVSIDSRIKRMSDADWHSTISTNLTGTFYTLRAAAKIMESQRDGRIVTVSSCMASHPAVGSGAYAATKAGISALTKVAALELGPRGILVNCVAPGILDEGMGADVADNPQLWERYRNHLALRRTGKVEEVARFVTSLTGPDTSYINGVTIELDGAIATWT